MKKTNIRILALATIIVGAGYLGLPYLQEKQPVKFKPVKYGQIDPEVIAQNRLQFKMEVESEEEVNTKKGDPDERVSFEMLKRRNPVTKDLPSDIRKREIEFSQKVDQTTGQARIAATDVQFTLRGPYNVGGRTRAMKMDVNRDSTINAGGVSGGMWKTTNFGQTWTKTTRVDQLSNATCVEQDEREGFTNVWYYGTGEIRGNSAGKTGAPYRGDGIYKSTDNGDSWEVIPATSTGVLSAFDSDFKYVNRILINHNNLNEREMYAAVFGGIVRTTDDFATYEYVLGSADARGGQYTEIAMTSDGVFYASISEESNDEQTGIWTSTDGINWTDITPYDDSFRFERIVMGIAPSNEDSVYFHTSGSSYAIHVYDASTETWADLSNNIPSFGGSVGDLAQGSYNMFIKVHPANAKVVYIGSTNLYRSTDGFQSTDNTSWIGGYAIENDVSIYPNHHPDQHFLEFLSEDPNYMISSNDGGVQVTFDNLKDTVDWVSLNNGYVTSQFYSAAVNLQDPGDNRLLGGLQDNSCYYGFSTDPNEPWQDIYGGDGAFTDITYNSLYVSSQRGRLYRYGFDEEGEQTRQGFIRPPGQQDGSVNYLFINPFTVDPVDPNRVYVAADRAVYYTLDAREFPNGDEWAQLSPRTTLPDANVSAIGVSTEPAHVTYVGMTNGQLFVMPNSSDNTLQMTEITGENFPEDGYINSIEVDENDADRAIVVFTNYEVLSAFLTEDGGETWEAISGNLEENADGSGAGIGVNWAESIRLSDGSYYYLLGTNTGLYGTDLLDGMNTVWTKMSPETIGNSVIDMIKVRSNDGYVVIGTHGDGMFEGYFQKDFELTVSKFGNLSICQGDSVTFRAAKSQNFNYQWYKDGTAVDGETDFYYTAKEGGDFYVVASTEAGDEFTSKTFSTSFNPSPDATITREGDILSVPDCGECEIRWIDTQGNTLGEGPTLDLTTTDKLTIRALISNDCFTVQSDRFDLVTGLSSDLDEVVSIYPNPAVDFINIDLTEIKNVQSIEVLDMKGAQLDVLTPTSNAVKYDISSLPKGLFVVRINTPEGQQSLKVVKQ